MKFVKFLKIFSVLLFIVSAIVILKVSHDMSTYGIMTSPSPWGTTYHTDTAKFIKISGLSILASAIVCIFIFWLGEMLKIHINKNDKPGAPDKD